MPVGNSTGSVLRNPINQNPIYSSYGIISTNALTDIGNVLNSARIYADANERYTETADMQVRGNGEITGNLHVGGKIDNPELSEMKKKIEKLEDSLRLLLCDEIIKKRIEQITKSNSKYHRINL